MFYPTGREDRKRTGDCTLHGNSARPYYVREDFTCDEAESAEEPDTPTESIRR